MWHDEIDCLRDAAWVAFKDVFEVNPPNPRMEKMFEDLWDDPEIEALISACVLQCEEVEGEEWDRIVDKYSAKVNEVMSRLAEKRRANDSKRV